MSVKFNLVLFKSEGNLINCTVEYEKPLGKEAGHIRCGVENETIGELVKKTIEDVICNHEHIFLTGLDLSEEDFCSHIS